MDPRLKIIKEKTAPSWLELYSENETEQYSVRFDGCIHMTHFYNGATVKTPLNEMGDSDSDYIHICHLDEYIATLQEVKQKALEHFGPNWPKL